MLISTWYYHYFGLGQWSNACMCPCCKSMLLTIDIVWGFSYVAPSPGISARQILRLNYLHFLDNFENVFHLVLQLLWDDSESHLVMCNTLKIVGAKTMLSSDGCSRSTRLFLCSVNHWAGFGAFCLGKVKSDNLCHTVSSETFGKGFLYGPTSVDGSSRTRPAVLSLLAEGFESKVGSGQVRQTPSVSRPHSHTQDWHPPVGPWSKMDIASKNEFIYFMQRAVEDQQNDCYIELYNILLRAFVSADCDFDGQVQTTPNPKKMNIFPLLFQLEVETQYLPLQDKYFPTLKCPRSNISQLLRSNIFPTWSGCLIFTLYYKYFPTL